MKRFSTSLIIREMQIKPEWDSPTLLRMAIIKKSTNNKFWRGCGEKERLSFCWWECKLAWSLRKTVSVQFSHSVVSDSLWPHGPQHARPPSPSSTPRVYSNSCPLKQWCHPAISSSVVSSSCPQSFPASGSFPMSQLFTSGGQSIGISASASVLPVNTQDWSPLGWTSWISAIQEILKSLLQHHSSKASSALSFLYSPTPISIHDHWKSHSFD